MFLPASIERATINIGTKYGTGAMQGKALHHCRFCCWWGCCLDRPLVQLVSIVGCAFSLDLCPFGNSESIGMDCVGPTEKFSTKQ